MQTFGKSARIQRQRIDKLTTAAILALIILAIGYTGHMDEQDLRAKTEGATAYAGK